MVFINCKIFLVLSHLGYKNVISFSRSINKEQYRGKAKNFKQVLKVQSFWHRKFKPCSSYPDNFRSNQSKKRDIWDRLKWEKKLVNSSQAPVLALVSWHCPPPLIWLMTFRSWKSSIYCKVAIYFGSFPESDNLTQPSVLLKMFPRLNPSCSSLFKKYIY